MDFFEKTHGIFEDRKENESELVPIDVMMATLDSEPFLEKSLNSIYKEIPVNRLIVCDGGSKDKTVEIFKKFPRVELHIRPDIRTGAKIIEFLVSQIKTKWCAIVDSDIELADGWYEGMNKLKNEFDVIESGKRIRAFHFYKEDDLKIKNDQRSYDMCHLFKSEALKDFHFDDDYMWRYTDYLFRQTIEKSGFKYGKCKDTIHINNETERILYKSDNEKNFQQITWNEPEVKIINKEKWRSMMEKNAKSIVKYLDPDFHLLKANKGIYNTLRFVDRDWIKKNAPQWLTKYDEITSVRYKIKRFIYKHFFSSN